jgi:hypothetical protein
MSGMTTSETVSNSNARTLGSQAKKVHTYLRIDTWSLQTVARTALLQCTSPPHCRPAGLTQVYLFVLDSLDGKLYT